jgi:hypothetical protein
MNQEVALYNRIQDPIAAAVSLGKPFALMFGLSNEAEGTFLALAAMAENRTPFEIVRTYDVVKGRLRKKALAVYAEFRAKGGKVKWINTGKDGVRAEAQFTFEDQTIVESFSLEEAKKQNLVKADSAWTKTPGNMLRARVLSNAIAMLCPEIIAGEMESPEDEIEPREAKPLLPTKEPKPAKVESVATVPPAAAAPSERPSAIESQSAGAATPIATEVVSSAAPTPAAKPVVSNWTHPKDKNKVSVEGAAALGEIIPADKQNIALKWMEARQWIPPMGSLLDLSPARAKAVYTNAEQFIRDIQTPAA